MRPRQRQTRANSSRTTREANTSQNMAEGTLIPNSRELEDGEVADITELAPEGHGITQDVDDIPDADHVPSSMVDEEEAPLEQVRVATPPSPLPQNKGKGHARTTSEDSVIVRPRNTTSRASQQDPSRDDDRPRRSRSTACPPRETRSRQSISDSNQRSEYSSTSHHSSYNLTRHVMSTMHLTQEMAEIKDQLAKSAAIRADARKREKEAEEETACSHLRLNNLEKAKHWQRKEAAAARRYTRALELRAQLAEEAVGQHQDGSHPDEERLRAVDEAWPARQAVESRHHVQNAGLTGDTRHVILPSEGPQRAQQPAPAAGPETARLYDNPARAIRQSRKRAIRWDHTDDPHCASRRSGYGP
jgi:hypothetical protein